MDRREFELPDSLPTTCSRKPGAAWLRPTARRGSILVSASTWGNETIPADPAKVYEATRKAFEAGAAGIVVSREYEEMRVPNLRAVGRAIRELKATG